MTINEYFQNVKRFVEKEYTDENGIVYNFCYRENAPRVVCADGFTMSVQVSDHHYCSPRVLDAIFYSSVEIGYPSEAEELLSDYAEMYGEDASGIYAYVPVEVVDKVIEKHGGLCLE